MFSEILNNENAKRVSEILFMSSIGSDGHIFQPRIRWIKKELNYFSSFDKLTSKNT